MATVIHTEVQDKVGLPAIAAIAADEPTLMRPLVSSFVKTRGGGQDVAFDDWTSVSLSLRRRELVRERRQLAHQRTGCDERS